MSRKPFEKISEQDLYGHRMDDCKNGCPDHCPAKQNAELVNAIIYQDEAKHAEVCAYYITKIEGFYDGTALGESLADRSKLNRELDKHTAALEEASKALKDYREENETLKEAVNFKSAKTPNIMLAMLRGLRTRLKEAEGVIEWYANWDWSDKYVQAVPKRAKAYLTKYEAGDGSED
jgi:predicted nuclease with TOPRIM domain